MWGEKLNEKVGLCEVLFVFPRNLFILGKGLQSSLPIAKEVQAQEERPSWRGRSHTFFGWISFPLLHLPSLPWGKVAERGAHLDPADELVTREMSLKRANAETSHGAPPPTQGKSRLP